MTHTPAFPLRLLAALGGCFALCSGGLHAQTASRLSTAFLARGEQALLEISVASGQPDDVPEISQIDKVVIQPTGRGPMPRMLPGRRMEFVYDYIVSSYEVGRYVIPPVEVMVGGTKTTTEPLDFEVFNPDALKWSEARVGEKIFRYASSFRALTERPYENETVPTEIKLFVPEELLVEDWGIPDFEREGLTAWRFQPSQMRSRIYLLGRRYVSIAYPSTVTPTRVGKVAIGPAKVRLTTREQVLDPFPRIVNPEVYLDVPKLEIESVALPEGAPEGFGNAVGHFRLTAGTAVTDVQEGDPITVDLIVSGSGNLDTLHPPSLENADGWKIYGTTTEQRGDERRQLAGTVVFHQSIRPLELKQEIPAYRLVYFDPKAKSYRTLYTEPIALQMRPNTSTAPNPATTPQTLAVPFERMTDILAVLREGPLTTARAAGLPPWLVHAAGTALALVLLGKALWLRYSPRLRKNPDREARLRELREIGSRRDAGDRDFLKAAGGFIERWLGTRQTPEISAVLAERDAVCFRADTADASLGRKRRGEILRLLRASAMALVFAIVSAPAARADLSGQALEAYESAKYDEAMKLWMEAGKYSELSAGTLYNIGNACYRSGAPGYASLFYRRALARDSAHQEARQNLRFLERKYGAITVQRPDFQFAVARMSLPAWQNVFWSGLWMCGLALLVFPATRPGARLRAFAAGALALGPILVSAGALGWRFFPTDAEFAPLARQAVVIAEKTVVHTDAARTSPEVIDAPPGSLCEIVRESGRWVYVSFATKTRGWIPAESLEKILPDTPPAPPKFRKPKGDGKTA